MAEIMYADELEYELKVKKVDWGSIRELEVRESLGSQMTDR